MRIKMTQTRSGTKKEYQIDGNKRQFFGKAPSLNGHGKLLLESTSGRSWEMKSLPASLLEMLPFGGAFGRNRRIFQYQIFYGERKMGMISEFFYDQVMRRYEVVYEKQTCFVYSLFQGVHELLLVFVGDRQIAEIRRETMVVDFKDNYELYLLDEEDDCEVPLILFLLYYDHIKHGDRGAASKGLKTKEISYSYGKANQLYDLDWFSKHFPNDPAVRLVLDPEKEKNWVERTVRINRLMECLALVVILAGLTYMVRVNPISLIGLALFVGGFLVVHGIRRLRSQKELDK